MASRIVLGLALLALVCLGSASTASDSECQHADSLSLNGSWLFAVGDGHEADAGTPDLAALPARPVLLPGPFLPWNEKDASELKIVWAWRTFIVSPAQAKKLAVLRWNHITFGAAAYINGRKVGENEPTGPYQVVLPGGVLTPGENQIVLRVAGAAGVRKSKSGYFLIPAGFASQHPRGMPAVHDDVWLDFADRAYLRSALALPDLAGGRVRFRVYVGPAEALQGIAEPTLAVKVSTWPAGAPAGSSPARPAQPAPGGGYLLEVALPDAAAWTPEQPNLYTAEITLAAGPTVLDTLSVRFGMREIATRDGRFMLNGKSLWLRGSDLVGEWTWRGDHGDVFTGHEKEYLVTEAREMSMNSFRTHTQPLPRTWADICDEYGTMILAEFPLLHNGTDFRFTPEEAEIFHRNCLSDARGWMERLWNHPAVVVWVLSNESYSDNEWEFGPYQDYVRSLDPTRPLMRTDNETKEIHDLHACGNTEDTDEGRLQADIPGWLEAGKGRVVTNTEYMNLFGRPVTQWTGTEDKEADALAYAQLGMEHTEAMRRARLAGIWPYMYAGWTKTRRGGQQWKAGYAQPISAALHSALSPVLASLDLFNANYLVGRKVITDLYLINDSWHEAKIHVDLVVTSSDPEFIPEAECFAQPLSRQGFDFTLPADSMRIVPVTWHVPGQVGPYWLAARTTGLPGRPVLSTRFLRACTPAMNQSMRVRTRVVLLGDDGPGAALLKHLAVKSTKDLAHLDPARDLALVWDAEKLTEQERAFAPGLQRFLAAGGKMAVLASDAWTWPALCDLTIPPRKQGWGNEIYRYSRAFLYPGVKHPMLAGVLPESLMRWNGLPGLVAFAPLQGPAMAKAQKLVWVRDKEHTVAAVVPLDTGGAITFCQLDLKRHLDDRASSYDPVAERILRNLLAE